MAVAEAVGPRRLGLTRRAPILALAGTAGAAMALAPWLRLTSFALAAVVLVQVAIFAAILQHHASRRAATVRMWPDLAGGLLSLIGLSLSTQHDSRPSIARGCRWRPCRSFHVAAGDDRLAPTALLPAAAVLSVSAVALAAAFMAAFLSRWICGAPQRHRRAGVGGSAGRYPSQGFGAGGGRASSHDHPQRGVTTWR